MATSSTHKGWKRDDDNSRLNMLYDATRIASISSSAMTVPTGIELDCESGSTLTIAGTLTATGKVTKANLNSEVYAIEHIVISGEGLDNQTIIATKVRSAGTIVQVDYFTDAAIGTSLGIDVVDGATDGNGSDVIDSCSDNLNGSDVNALTTPYALSAGDYINLVVDDITNSIYIRVDIHYRVPLSTAT